MLVKGPFEKARQYIESHSEHFEKATESNKIIKAGPCITISRETGARADVISEKLINIFQERFKNNPLHWTVFDKNLIEKVLQDHHLPKTLSKLMEEEKYSAIKSISTELLGGQPAIWTLVYKTIETILQIAQIGNVIILDRGANIITSKLPNTFHARLVAPLEFRIEHIRQLFNYDKKEAVEYIKREDQDRRDYVMNYFHKEINDPQLYNITLNTALFTDDEAAQIIGTAVISKFKEMFFAID